MAREIRRNQSENIIFFVERAGPARFFADDWVGCELGGAQSLFLCLRRFSVARSLSSCASVVFRWRAVSLLVPPSFFGGAQFLFLCHRRFSVARSSSSCAAVVFRWRAQVGN